MSHPALIVIALLLAQAMSACGGGSPAPRPVAKTSSNGGGSGGSSASTAATGDDDDDDADSAEVRKQTVNWLDGIKEMSDDDAVAYMKKQCGKCHDSKAGGARSFWSMETAKFSRKALEADAANGRVYQTVVQGAKQLIGQRPSGMPQNTEKWTAKQITELKTLVKWFDTQLPGAVQSAQTQFGGGAGAGSGSGEGGVGIVLNFKCGHPSTFRQYMNRLAQDVFSRNATPEELKLGGDDPDVVVKAATRKKIAGRLFTDDAWKKEFTEVGLKKFADKFAGASGITGSEGQITEDEAADLQQEFYQKLKREYETKSFKDILLSPDVMISAKTAKFYDGCVAGGDWSSCAMKAPRDSFFTTMGYLRSKPSSFLSGNNNYGRAALMHFIVRGDVFRAAFDQDGGGEDLQALPTCLVSKDFRVEKNGEKISPFGSLAIPSYANLCQSCHIERQMAAGSILFRPFNSAGLIYKKGDAVLDIAQDKAFKDIFPDPTKTTTDKVKNHPKGTTDPAEDDISPAYLQALLDDLAAKKEKGCVPAAGDDKEVTLNQVGDLAKYLIGDGKVLAGGLARHIPRAMSNVDNTSEEIVVRFNSAFSESGGKIGPLFQAYFTSETYACERN